MTTLTVSRSSQRTTTSNSAVPGCQRTHACLRIGEIEVELHCEIPEILNEYLALYPGCEIESIEGTAIQVIVRHRRLLPFTSGYYEVRWGPRRKFVTRDTANLLPYMEWAVNRQITLKHPEYVQIHASVVQGPGGGLVFPADPGSGKSTLSMGLVRRGWNYLSDEFALIDTTDGLLKPYPKAICVKEGSYEVVRSMGIGFDNTDSYIKPLKGRVRFLRPDQVRDGCIGSPCPLQSVIFPKYIAGSKSRLIPISRAEAAFEMNHQCFNFLDHGNSGLELISGLIRQVECYRLISGGLDTACDVLEVKFGNVTSV